MPSSERRWPGPDSSIWLTPEWFGEALAEIVEAGDGYGAARPTSRSGSRSRWCPPTRRAAHRRLCAKAAYGDSSRGCSSSPGTKWSASILQRRRPSDRTLRESVEARRRGEEPPEDGYQRRLRRGDRGPRGRSGPGDDGRDPRRARELQGARRHMGASRSTSRRRSRKRSSGSRRTKRRERSGRRRRSTATTRTGLSCAHRTAAISTTPPTSPTCSTTRARLRPGNLRARRRSPRLRATPPSGSRAARIRAGPGRGAHLSARVRHRAGGGEAHLEAAR